MERLKGRRTHLALLALVLLQQRRTLNSGVDGCPVQWRAAADGLRGPVLAGEENVEEVPLLDGQGELPQDPFRGALCHVVQDPGEEPLRAAHHALAQRL